MKGWQKWMVLNEGWGNVIFYLFNSHAEADDFMCMVGRMVCTWRAIVVRRACSRLRCPKLAPVATWLPVHDQFIRIVDGKLQNGGHNELPVYVELIPTCI